MKKYHAAAGYFTRALAEGEKDVTGNYSIMLWVEKLGMTAFARSKRLQVLYNMGNKLLFTGNPELAFKCFQESSLLYYKQPKLWLRLAECCVGSHVKKVLKISGNYRLIVS
jgi:CCR4-NOT transcription complex subunit 10